MKSSIISTFFTPAVKVGAARANSPPLTVAIATQAMPSVALADTA
jgi:hypothetical protein